tara:strand:+ start:875 stop:1423 length:549 start_codon:yes stop_codon:yes gene_type:complete
MKYGIPICFALFLSAQAQAFSLQGTAWERIANDHGLDGNLLYAIALVESAKLADKTSARPTPLALHVPDGAVYPDSHGAAMDIIDSFRHAPKSIDIGIMQINAGWHGQRVGSLEDLLDMNTNIRVAAEILSEAIRSAPGDIELGVGRYHNWNEPISRKYGRRVISVWSRLNMLADAKHGGAL